MSKDTLKEFCNNIGIILSRASIDEALIDKPGNASRLKDIKTVKFQDIVYSALIMKDYYEKACRSRTDREYNGIYRFLYEAVLKSQTFKFSFSIFGTAMQLLPIAYSSLFSLSETLVKASQVIRGLDKNDSKYFSLALKELSPSYLGKMEEMDYTRLEEYELYDVLLKSAQIDSSVRNMIYNYKYSLEVMDTIRSYGLREGVIYGFLKILCEIPDGLIFRKHGGYIALRVSSMACDVLNKYSKEKVKEFDNFLTANNYNPGSTADIIATGIAIYYLDEWYKKNSLSYTGTMQRGCDRFS